MEKKWAKWLILSMINHVLIVNRLLNILALIINPCYTGCMTLRQAQGYSLIYFKMH